MYHAVQHALRRQSRLWRGPPRRTARPVYNTARPSHATTRRSQATARPSRLMSTDIPCFGLRAGVGGGRRVRSNEREPHVKLRFSWKSLLSGPGRCQPCRTGITGNQLRDPFGRDCVAHQSVLSNRHYSMNGTSRKITPAFSGLRLFVSRPAAYSGSSSNFLMTGGT
jgi:hypothetical protein